MTADPARLARSEAAAIGITAVTNLIGARVSSRAVLPLNLAAAGAVTALAGGAGLSTREMGMSRADVGSGVRWGLAAGVLAAGGVLAASRIPAVRSILADEQAHEVRGSRLGFEAAVRVPLATALPEEILFRGALLAIFERRRDRRAARAMSALLYGVWHLIPVLQQLRSHPERGRLSRRRHRLAVLAGTLASTTVAGYGFAWLRDRSGSVVAPAIAHAAVNATGLLAGVRAARR